MGGWRIMVERPDRSTIFKDGQKGEKIMKIRRWKTVVLAPILLSLPMMCMHSGDGHHSGSQHSIAPQPPNQYLSQGLPPEGVSGVGKIPIPENAPDRS
jgi:hypothetical protein